MTKLLIDLIDAVGPSGFEGPVRSIIQKEMKKHVDKVYKDKFGNLICHKKGKGEKVMLAAHMDEIALMVKKIEENGFIRVSPVGGIETTSLIGQGVLLFNDNNKEVCKGIISFPELHDATEVEELPAMEDLYVDTGLGASELKKKGVRIGSYLLPLQDTFFLGSKKVLVGKAMDDRVGCYALIELARRLKKSSQDIYYVFTVQEEIGLYGAKTATWEIKPDWGIAVETTVAADSDVKGVSSIGNGPYLTIKDSEMISNKCIDDHIKMVAKKQKIPLQLEVSDFGTTDATSIMLSRGGIPSTTISVPVRNIHSTVGIIHIDDVENMIKILHGLLKNPPKVCVL